MRVFDKTPFQDEKGNISLTARIQGTLKYGTSWYAELESQKFIVALLDRLLEKGFVLIRNFNLPGSDIVIPIILIGPGTLNVIVATPVKGHFEAKGTEWNIVSNGSSAPAGKNLVNIALRQARAFQKYLEIHKINVPMQVDAVLIASDPGANIESVRPAVRVVRSDALKQFASSLNQARPLLRVDQVNAVADLILEPRPKTTETPPEPKIPVEPPAARPQQPAQAMSPTPTVREARPQPALQKAPAAQPARKKKAGFSQFQLTLLVVMGLAACCLVASAAYIVYTAFPSAAF